jgi:hypothetical protein
LKAVGDKERIGPFPAVTWSAGVRAKLIILMGFNKILYVSKYILHYFAPFRVYRVTPLDKDLSCDDDDDDDDDDDETL